jgi:hypothetical protein
MEPGTRNKDGSSSYMQFAPGDGIVTMEKTTLIKLGKIALAAALAFSICGIAVRPALADDHHRGGGDRGHNEGHDRDRYQGGGSYSYAPQPSYYYAPRPNYYYAPEPDQYAYTPQQGYYAPAPSQGVNLFFGLF